MTRARGPRRSPRALLSLLCSLLLTMIGLPVVAHAADNDAELSIEQYIAGHQDEVPTFAPGQNVIFTVNVQCSSTETGTCLDAVLTDELPEPLVFDDTTPMSITPNIATGQVDGRTLTVTFNGDGFEAGQVPTITINAKLPVKASGDFDARTLRNPVTIRATNADPVSDTVALKLDIPMVLAASAAKSATPDEVLPALPGRAESFTIRGGNDSNVSVDSLVLTDPADLGAATFDRLAVTGLSDLSASGADRVALDWYDGDTWHPGTAVAIPDDPATLLPADPSLIHGLVFTFTRAGQRIAAGSSVTVTLDTTSRDNFGDVGAGQTLRVDNTVAVSVERDSQLDTARATASVGFEKQPVKVTVTKSFAEPELVSGRTTTATITAATGVMPVSRLEISEPASGQPDLAAQDLGFGGFVTDTQAPQVLTWPAGAERAEITYRYADGDPETKSTTQPHTLPAPDEERRVTGFMVVFTAAADGIQPRAKAILPFDVTAGQVTVEAGVTSTNTVTAEASSEAPDSARDTTSADLTLLPLRVRAAADKTIARDTIWASPGTTNTVSLTGRVAQSSTVGAEYLTVTDEDPDFWDYVDLRRIHSTDIPANADLTVSYYDGTTWQQLTDPVPGPRSDWSYTPTADQRAALRGLEFRFVPKTEGSLLPAGFNVVPRFDVALRRALRSDPQAGTNLDTTISDTATVEVGNQIAIEPVRTATASDTMTLRATGGSGGGGSLWLATKRWIDPIDGSQVDAGVVSALSDGLRTSVIDWGTDGLSLTELRLLDDPSYDNPAGSFYDAFDLVRIQPITTAIDPEIGRDRVSRVELYSSATGGWVDVTTAACPTTAACDGRFNGYTLTEDEQRATLAARLTFAPGSASETGEIALSSGADRQVRYDFRLRRTLRSDPSRYVLGETHGHPYNAGHAGTVTNQVEATGILTEPDADGQTTVTSGTSASLSILDQPLNVSLTKVFDQTQLGLPQRSTTPAGDYPLVESTLTAANETAGAVPELVVSDPSPAVPGWGAYDHLNLYQVRLASLPVDLTSADVDVDLTAQDGGTRHYSAAEAEALTPAELADVVGVRVSYGAYDNLADPSRPLIASGATATVVLTYQLRADVRGTETAVADGDHIVNSAQAVVLSPGGIACSGDDTCDTPTASDSDSLSVVQPTYEVVAGKSLNWTSRYEDQSATGYVVTLTGQPDGTARTKLLTLTDAAPTFWNAFALAGLPTITLPEPVNELRLSVLTGVDFQSDAGTLGYRCAGDAELTGCWHEGEWQAANAAGQVTLTLPEGVTADQVRGVRIDAQRRVDGTVTQWERPANPTLIVRLNVTRRATLVHGPNGFTGIPVPTTREGQPTAPGETAQAVTTDQSRVTGTASWLRNSAPYTDTRTATASTTLRHRVNSIKVEKTPGQGTGSQAPRYDLDATIPYQLKVTNTGAWNMTGLRLSDRIDPVGGSSPLVAADADPVFTVKVDGTAVAGFATGLDPATGVVTIGVPDGFVLAPGQVLLVTANLRFRDQLEAGTVVTNTVTATSDRPFETCEYTRDASAQQPTGPVTDCSASTTVVTAASSPMSVSKVVKGAGAGVVGAEPGDPDYDDLGVIAVGNADATACATPGADGFYSYPCTPITRPGGREIWQLTVANNGNVPANTISAIDVLPGPGDTGVVVGTSRKSRFSPAFLGEVEVSLAETAAAHTIRTFYTTSVLGPSCNKADILNDTKPSGQDHCGIDWHEFTGATAAETLAQAKAIKFLLSFTDPGQGLDPGQKFSVRFATRTPAYADVADPATVEPVAWNSVAVGSRTAEFETFASRASLVTEPRKVGVALASGALDLTKVVDAPADAAWRSLLPTSYSLALTCTSQGRQVPLRGSSMSSDASGVTLAADGTVLHYNGTYASNLPLGAECSGAETAVQGAEAAYSSTSVVAARSYAGVANIAHGHTGAAAGTLTVTNTYRNAGFTVTKAVAGPTALDAAHQPVHFKDDTVTASCRFLGVEVVPVADRTIGIRGGESVDFTGLPAGADCTVTETYPAGAAATSVELTQGGQTSAADDASSDFALVAGDDPATTVAFTNTYTVGAVRITKQLSGDGAAAWGDQPFEAELRCTHADADPGLVYSARQTLTRSDTTWLVMDLPTGADCTVTETKTGGATTSTISGGGFTVGNDPGQPSDVRITNRFATGSVEVTKRVLANGATTTASPWADTGFEVTLGCTRQVDGASLPVAVPDGATRVLDRDGGWKAGYAGLPTGATCAVTEGDATIAGQPAPQVTITSPVSVGDGTTAGITVTNDYPAGKLAITKALSGAGTSFFTTAQFGVSCTLSGYETPVFAPDGVVVTRPSLSSAQLGPIPFGADCTVTETATGGADATPSPQTVRIDPAPEHSDVTSVGFTNSFSAGRVTIGKLLTGPAAGESWATNATFTLAVRCGLTATGPYSYSGNISVKGGQQVTLKDAQDNDLLFPVGTHCWATETGTAGAVTSGVDHDSYANAVVVQASPASIQDLAITATNSYTYAGLTISKTVVAPTLDPDGDGTPLDFGASFGFTVTCGLAGSQVFSQPVTIVRQAGVWPNWTKDKLPTGANCTVTEGTRPGVTGTTSVLRRTGRTDVAGNQAVSIDALSEGGVADNVTVFTNTYGSGTLELTKQLGGSGAGSWATRPITVHVECSAASFIGGTQPFFTKDVVFDPSQFTGTPKKQAVRLEQLPANASCVVSEPAAGNGGANGQTYNPTSRTVTITDGGAQGTTLTAAGVTNTFNTGTVTVAKALLVNGQDASSREPWASGRYTVTLHCTRTVNGGTETLTVPGATKVITGAGSVSWTGLPQGASCAASEDAVAYPDQTPTQPDPASVTLGPLTVTVGNNTTVTQTVTNSFAYGGVRITKQLTGEAAGAYASAPFTFGVGCTLDGSAGTVFSRTGVQLQRSSGETTLDSGVIGPIPQGAVCTVTETGTGGATSVTPASRTVILDSILAGGNRTAEFSNEFRYAGFTVTKTVDDGGATDAAGRPIVYLGSYGFTASCLFNGTEVIPAADRSFTLTRGEDGTWPSRSFEQLPSGASCSVTEAQRAGVGSTSVRVTRGSTTLVDTESRSTGTFTLATGDATTTSVGFTNHYTTGSLEITKRVDGAGAALWGGGTFTIALACTLDTDANPGTAAVTVYQASHQLVRDASWLAAGLPTGATCVLTEPKRAGANGTSIPALAAITTGVQDVTVTNSFTTGSVQVTKVLRANGGPVSAEPWASGSYPVTLHCTKDFDSDGTAEEFAVPGATKTITGAGSATWTGLPQGASCTASEGVSAVTSQPQPTPSITGPVTVGPALGTLTLTNDFTAGRLVVHKQITGDGAAWGRGPFVAEVNCTLAGHGTVFARTVTLTPTAGQTSLDSTELGPVPVGSSCAVTETNAAGATAVTTPAPATIQLDPATGDITTLSLTNEFRQAGFTVSKVVDNGGAKDSSGAGIAYRAATFTASCRFQDAEVLQPADQAFSLADGQSRAVTGLPTGADCTVTETDAAGAPATTTAITQGGGPVADTAPGDRVAGFTLVSGDASVTGVAFTNAYTTGSVRIDKELAGNGAALWADPSFTARLRCTLAVAGDPVVFDAYHELTTAQPWTVTNLPTGADCAVTETASGAANSSATSNPAFTVGTGTTLSVVTNTYTLGAVRVSKQLTVDGEPTSAAPWTSGSYTVRLACTRRVNGVDTAIAIPGGAIRTITGAGAVTYTDLPTGADCVLAETGSSPASQQTTVSPGHLVVGDSLDTPQAVTIANDFHTSMLTIRKQLAGAGQESFGGGPFAFQVGCTLAGAGPVFSTAVSLTRPVGSPATSLASGPLGPVPVGAVCTVAETGTGGADATPDPVTLTIAEDDAANQAAFTNQFSAGTIWLTKQLAGAAAAEPWATGATFQVDVTCQVELDSSRGTVFSRRVNIAGGQRLNVTDADGQPSRIPLGAHCFSNEAEAQGAGGSTDAHDSFANAVVVTAGTPGSLQALELGVTNTYEYAGFTITKAVANGGAADAEGRPVAYDAHYGFQAGCTLAGRSVLSQNFTLADGGSREFTGLPAGADCSVTETGAAAAVATAVQVTQNGTPATPVTGSTTTFTLQRGWLLWPDSPATNRVAYTNSYAAGGATITKAVTGSGAAAWGAGPFTLRLVCTLDADADPATAPMTVFDGSHQVTRTDATWQVTNLPAGADCTATETATGGANTAAGPAVFVVNDDPANPVPVQLTNYFGTGSVLVSKTILVDGTPSDAQPFASAEYRVRLACTRWVDGATVAVDIPGDAAPAGDPADGLRSVTGAGSVRYDGLPAGADCTATELAAGLPLPPEQVTDGASTSVPDGGIAALEVANDYHTGTLVVAKALEGAGAGTYADGDFSFDVSCTLTDTSEVAHRVYGLTGLTLSRAAGLMSAPLGPIPVGSACVVTETADGGADQPAEPATVTIADGTPTTATLTNTFTVGAVQVRLGVTLDGVPTDGTPYVTGRYDTLLSCTRLVNGVEVPVDIPGGAAWTTTGPGERTVTGLPVGADCAVGQTYASLIPRAVSYAPDGDVRRPSNPAWVVASGSVRVVAGDDPAILVVIDDFTTSTLTVSKVLDGAGVADHADRPFGFAVSCTLAEDGLPSPHQVYDTTVTLSRAEGLTSAPLGPIPVGAECVVTETASGGATIAADPVTLTIAADQALNMATLGNSFQVGTVTVAKHLTVDGRPSTDEPYASGTYTVQLACTRMVDGVPLPVTIPGGSTRTITGAGRVDFTGLPLDADCRVSEPATSLALPAGQVTIAPAAVTVGTEPVTVDVTNDYRTGTMVLRWRQAGVGSGFAGAARFTVDCTLAGAEGSVFHAELDLAPVPGQEWAESGVLGPIPIGASCTVTQHSADGADTVAAPVTVTGAGTAVLAEVANEYSAGVVTVTKELTGTGASEHGGTTFTVALTCSATAGGEPYATAEVRITGAGTAILTDENGQPLLLPAGTRCWASETDDGGAAWSVVDHRSFETAAVVTTDDPDTVQVLEITVTNAFAARELAFTGSGPGTWWLLALGLALLGTGAGLAGRRRVRGPQPKRAF